MSETNDSKIPKTRSGTINYGQEYEQHISALLGIKCVFNSDIKDMWMASNVDEIGAFDDLVIFTGCKSLFLIQIKYRGKEINSNILMSKNKDFSLAKYEKSFLNIKDKFESNSLPFPFEGEFQNITFILFTNSELNNYDRDHRIIFNKQKREESFLNTGQIFKIRNGKTNTYDDNFLKQFRLYCSQVAVSQIGNKIDIEVDKCFKQVDIANTIMRYFSDWSKDMFVNKQILTKRDLHAKLLEIILSLYVTVPKEDVFFQKAPIWNDIIDEFDGIFLKNDKHLPKVYFALQLKIQKLLKNKNIKIINWNNLLDNATDIINEVSEKLQPHLKHYSIKKKTDTYKVKDLIMLLWNACQLPLVIKLSANSYSQENVVNAILKFDNPDCKRRYIFFGDKPFDLPNQTVFTNLTQASKQNLRNALRNIEVSLQNRESIPLDKLSPNKKTLKAITTDIFLDLLENQPVMNTNVNNYYIRRYLRKPLISRDVLYQKNAVFVLTGNMKQINQIKQIFDPSGCFEFWPHYQNFVQSDYLQNFERNPKLISIIAIEELSIRYEDMIKTIKQVSQNENQTVHFFQLNEGNNLEWLYSNQNANMLKRITNVGEDHLLPDKNLFDYLNFNVLSGRSGEGKTMLLHYLKDNCPPDMWMIYLNLSDISGYIKNKEFSRLMNFLFDISNEPNSELDSFFRELFENLLNKLNVVIVIDGLDDIKYGPNTEALLKCIKNLGIPTLLVIRPLLQNFVERNFNTLSLHFKPFTKDEQEMLKPFMSQENINTFSEDDIDHIIHETSSSDLFEALLTNEKSIWLDKCFR